MNNKISLIIPIYNASKYLERTLKSALAQSYNNLEIILIDDGSTDNSSKICKKFANNNKKIKYYYQNNHGVSSARNLGIKKATGDYITFLDADDTLDKDVINNLIKNYSKRNLISSSMLIYTNKYKKTIVKRNEVYNAKDGVLKIINGDLQGFACGYLFKKSMCPKFEEKIGYCEDMVFLIDYICNNQIKKIHFLKNVDGYYNYYINNDSTTKSNKDIIKKLNHIQTAMNAINNKTDNKYTKLINNKEILLFESEIQHANKNDIKKIVYSLKLPKYTGNSFRIKLFSYCYNNKQTKLLILYYDIRKIMKKIAS